MNHRNAWPCALLALSLCGCFQLGVSDDSQLDLNGPDQSPVTSAPSIEVTPPASDPVGQNSATPITVQSLDLNADALQLSPGQLAQLELQASLSNGARFRHIREVLSTPYMVTQNATWYSNNTDIVTVSSSGRLTAQAAGTTTVKASLSNQSVVASVTVASPAARTYTLSALAFHQHYSRTSSERSLSLTFDATFAELGVVTNVDSRTLATAAACPLSLASSSDTVGILDESATFTPLANGTTELTAQCGEIQASLPLSVTGLAQAALPAENPSTPDDDAAAPEADAETPTGDTAETEDTELPTSLAIDMDFSNTDVGTRIPLSCQLEFDSGQVDANTTATMPSGQILTLTWEVSDTSRARVSGNQLVLLRPGAVTLTVSYAGQSNSVDFAVTMQTEDPSDPSDAFLNANDNLSFTVGENGGFGSTSYPDVIYAAPQTNTHVLSFGQGGELLVELQGFLIADGPGPDFTIFENAFSGWAEPAVVAVSEDGVDYFSFACDPADPSLLYTGCAGVNPVNYGSTDDEYRDPSVSGGDSFDLSDVGLTTVRYVKITDGDVCTNALVCIADKAGFDLDAVAIVNGVNE